MSEDLLGLIFLALFALSALIHRSRSRPTDAQAPESPTPTQTGKTGLDGATEQASLAPPAGAVDTRPRRRTRKDRPLAPLGADRTGRRARPLPTPRQAMIALAVYGPCRADSHSPH